MPNSNDFLDNLELDLIKVTDILNDVGLDANSRSQYSTNSDQKDSKNSTLQSISTSDNTQHAKNPISCLLEKCMKTGIPSPTYTEKERTYDKGTNRILFKFDVTVGGESAIGTFQPSKQLAKKDAATVFFEQKGEPWKDVSTKATIVDANQFPNETVRAGTNYVGFLQELCLKKQLPPPLYGIEKSVGPPHCPTFYTFCEVGPHRHVVASSNKKIGKQLVAEKVIESVKTMNDSQDSSIQATESPSESDSLTTEEKFISETVEDNGIQIPNPVGYLQELCVKKRLSPPIYGVEKVTGPQHNPTFYTFCQLGQRRQVVTSNNKKTGKELAARKIIICLGLLDPKKSG